jgi:hypothetical protein
LIKAMADPQSSVDAGFASLDVQELREQLGAKPDELVPEPDIPDWVDGRSERVWERIEEEIEEEPSLTTFPDEPSWTQQYAREQEQDGRATGYVVIAAIVGVLLIALLALYVIGGCSSMARSPRAGRKAIREINARQRRAAAQGLKELQICIGKTGYPDEEQALIALSTILGRGTTRSKPVRAYLCGACGKWHLTSSARGSS